MTTPREGFAAQTLPDAFALGEPLTYRRAARDDTEQRYPQASLDRLSSRGFTEQQVPDTHGGGLSSIPDLIMSGRLIASRDPAVAVIANARGAACMPVWIDGSQPQCETLARAVLAGDNIAFALTEREHGADLTAGELTASRTEGGYLLDGEKWLINNARRADQICLLARTGKGGGVRSMSMFLVDVRSAGERMALLPRIPTHGIRAAEISGFRFDQFLVPDAALVGRLGRGLELAGRALHVTRTVVPAFSLGALETALHCTLDFCRNRRLYGARVIDIGWVREELAAVAVSLKVLQALSDVCGRCVQLLPELLPISSAVAKYLIPHTVFRHMKRLATILGARFYLREGHWSGIFEKLFRDARLFGLFDGSEPVVLSALAAQASCVVEHASADSAMALFDPKTRLPPVGEALRRVAFVAESDPILAGLDGACMQLREADGVLDQMAGELELAGSALRREANGSFDARSQAGQRIGDKYARTFAATCIAREWLGSRRVDPLTVALGLSSVLQPTRRMSRDEAEAILDTVEVTYG